MKAVDIRDTPEWVYVQDVFKRIYANRPNYSIIGIAPTPGASWAAMDHVLQQILERCPQFFPALFQRGEYLLRIGKTSEGEELIDQAFHYLFDILTDEEEFSEAITPRTENLGELLRYDLAAKYMENATQLFPGNASFYDYLAFYLLQLPGRDKNVILKIQQKALEIEPDNDFFINNLGWIYLMMGKYEEAGEYFRQAIAYSSESTALQNLETANYMEEHNMNYSQYLLRLADQVQPANLQECADFEEAADICKMYNSDKVEAFKIDHLQKNTPPHEILDILYPLQEFLKTIHESIVSGEGIFLFENSDLFFEKSEIFLSEFIVENEVDYTLPDSTLDSLTVFYDFLKEVNIITADRYAEISGRINLLKSVTQLPPSPDMSWDKIDRGLAELINEAPHYYPVLFKWGEYMLQIGRNPEGEKCLDQAFNAAISILTKNENDDDEDNLKETFSEKAGNLKKLLRYDLAAKYMEEAIRMFPEEAFFYDHLAAYLLYVPGNEENRIVEIQQKALALEPDNDSYINNLGWIYLMKGNYPKAVENFETALDYNSENVEAVENLEIAEYMQNRKLTYLQFLLYVVPGEIQSFSDVGAFDDDLNLVDEYNDNKIKAFEIDRLQKRSLAPHEISNIIKPLETLLDIIYELQEDDTDFFFENIDLFLEKARYFIYQFLDRSELEGEQALNAIIHSLTVFYNFLGEMNIITPDQNNRVVEQLNLLKTGFAGKLAKYYEICDDFTLDAEEKEERVAELFDI